MGAWWVELTGRTDASYLFRTDIRRRVSPEPLSLTQGLPHSRGFINICQMREEFSQPMPTGVGGCLASRGSNTDLPSCLDPTGGCTAPHQGTPKVSCRGGGGSGEKAWRGDASFLPSPLSPQTPPPTQSPAWARVHVRRGNGGRVTSGPGGWLGPRQRAGQRGGWLLRAP